MSGEESISKNILIADATRYVGCEVMSPFLRWNSYTEGTLWVEEDLRGFLSGDGEIPIKDWVEAIKSMDFDGTYSSELLSPKHWECDLL